MSSPPISLLLGLCALAGVGMDWNASGGWFGTLRVQRSLRNDSVILRSEYLGSLTEGDGTVRAEIEWRARDGLSLSGGADLLFGDREGLFGQFRCQDRVWLRVRWSFG